MRNRLLHMLLLCATGAAAQIPSLTTNSKLHFVEGNTIFDRTVGDIFSTIDVSLTTGVTGTLPVANGGTGIATLTANRIPYGNGTSAFQSSGNLTFDGSTHTISGYGRINLQSSSTPGLNITGTMTSVSNSQTWSALSVSPVYANSGALTNQFYYGTKLTASTTTPTAATITTAVRVENVNTSANVSQFYGLYGRIDENTTTGNLSNRAALRFDVNKTSDALDAHTGTGINVNVQENSATGRWNTGTVLIGGVTNAISGTGCNLTINNSRGTGATQTGIQVTNLVSGSGVTTANAYGIQLLLTEASSGAHGTYYGIHNTSTPVATTNYLLYNSTDFRNYLNGSLAIGADDTSAKLFVRGPGTTSGTNTALFENSSGTDILTIRDDGASAFGGSPTTDVRLTVAATTADSQSFALDAKRSSTSVLKVRADGKVAVNNAAFQDALTVNGKARADGLVLTNQTATNTSSGQVQYNNGGGSHSGYVTVGDGTRQLAFMPTMIERDIVDYNVDWTTGRKGAFWTVPARFDGWKIAKVYIGITNIGSGAGDDELTIEIGGVGEGVQIVTAGTHTLVMDDVINTDDVITFNITEISATPAKGLNVALELSKN